MMDWLIDRLRALGAYVGMIREVGIDIGRHGLDIRETSRMIVRIGVYSLPIIALTAVFTGMVLAVQTAYGLERFGAKIYVGNIIGLGIIRELAPVLSSLLLCGRVGAGTAAELAAMTVTEQVDAMRALGADPVRKLITPRIIAATIAVPALVAMANLIGMYGGALVAVNELNLSAHAYYRSLIYSLVVRDFFDGAIKAAFFGFLLMSIACFKGLRVRGGTEGVGITTTEAVVISSIVIFVSNFFITKLLIML